MTAPSDRPLRLEYLNAADLHENPANWRLHPTRQLQLIDSTIKEVGWAGALLYNEQTRRLLDGHARRQLFAGRNEPIPVLVGSWDEATEKKILAVLDPLKGLAGTDHEMLDALLRDIGAEGDLADMLEEITSPTVFTTITVPLASLKFHPQNYKKHPAEQIAHIAHSIQEHGFYRNVVVARDNTVLAGQGVVEAALKLGHHRIPVIRLDLAPDEPRAMKVLISDNEIAKLGEVDDRALTELLKGIMEADELLGTGFDEQQLANLAFVTRPRSELKDFDEAAEWVGMPEYESVPKPLRLVVSFRNEADRVAFMQLIEAPVLNKTRLGVWSIWWPPQEKRKPSQLRFSDTTE